MPLFILGAGFNADTSHEVKPDELGSRYPLITEAARICFDLESIPADKSVEDMFSEALRNRDFAPIRKLADCLRQADSLIGWALAQDSSANCYQRFFRQFPSSNFLTFNYDSLPEILLYKLRCWYPNDGYGVRVNAKIPPFIEGIEVRPSSALVLHLHGTLCISTSEWQSRRKEKEMIAWMERCDEPQYYFDPSSITGLFAPYERQVGADDIEDRIIAPVPNKAEGLKSVFIKAVNARALELIRGSNIVVAIGYSFNRHDRTSYQTLLQALAERDLSRLVVVSPDAKAIANEVRIGFPGLTVHTVTSTFREWVNECFPGAV